MRPGPFGCEREARRRSAVRTAAVQEGGGRRMRALTTARVNARGNAAPRSSWTVTWNHNQKEATPFAAESRWASGGALVSIAAGRLGLQPGRGSPDATIHQVVMARDDRARASGRCPRPADAQIQSLAASFREGCWKPLFPCDPILINCHNASTRLLLLGTIAILKSYITRGGDKEAPVFHFFASTHAFTGAQ